MNTPDIASRGLGVNKNTSSSDWFKRPEFLWYNETSWSVERTEAIIDGDHEVKHLVTVNRIAKINGMLSYLTQRISNWKKLKKIVDIIIQSSKRGNIIILKITNQNNHIKIFPCCRNGD